MPRADIGEITQKHNRPRRILATSAFLFGRGPVYRDPEPPGVPLGAGREGESDEERVWRRFPITAHKPLPYR